MKYVLPAILAALVASFVTAFATVVVNPQTCALPSVCQDIIAALVPQLNSSAILSPAYVGLNTFAALGNACTTAQKGQMWVNTDGAATPVYNAIATGSGTTAVPIVCDGTNWRNH